MTVMEIPSSFIPSYARGLHVLLVDDDTTSLMHLASSLEQYTYKVTTTELASAALSMIDEENHKIELVMANIDVPDMDGLKFMGKLFKKNIPFIMISSERSVSVAKMALNGGASLCLDKPITSDDLKHVWQHVFRKRVRPADETVHCRVKEIGDDGGETKLLPPNGNNGLQGTSPRNDCTNHRQILADPEGECKLIEAEAQGRRQIETEEAALGKENFAGDAETIDIEELVIAEIERRCGSANTESHQQSGSKRINNDDENQNKDKKVENKSSQVISNGAKKASHTIANDSSAERRPRISWTGGLQQRFMAAISSLGDKKARPRKIHELMNVPYLSQRQVASHLQRYKAQIRRLCDSATTASSALNESSRVFNVKSGSDKLGNQSSAHHGIGVENFELLKAATESVSPDILSSHTSGNKNKTPAMSAGTALGLGSGGGYFTVERVANAIKFAATFTGWNQKLDSVAVKNPATRNVPDAFKFATNTTAGNQKLGLRVSNPSPSNLATDDKVLRELNQVTQGLDAITVSEPPPSSLNQSQSQLLDYAELLDLLEEEPVSFKGSDELDKEEVARYSEFLSKVLCGNNSPQL